MHQRKTRREFFKSTTGISVAASVGMGPQLFANKRKCVEGRLDPACNGPRSLCPDHVPIPNRQSEIVNRK